MDPGRDERFTQDPHTDPWPQMHQEERRACCKVTPVLFFFDSKQRKTVTWKTLNVTLNPADFMMREVAQGVSVRSRQRLWYIETTPL